MQYFNEVYPAGTRVRLVEDAAGDLPTSIMRRKGTIKGMNAEHSIDGIVCYDVVMDNRVRPKILYHEELELV